MMKKMIMWGGGGGKKKERGGNFKNQSKPDDIEGKKIMMRNMVQIHDEQRSIQMTISHRGTKKKY